MHILSVLAILRPCLATHFQFMLESLFSKSFAILGLDSVSLPILEINVSRSFFLIVQEIRTVIKEYFVCLKN